MLLVTNITSVDWNFWATHPSVMSRSWLNILRPASATSRFWLKIPSHLSVIDDFGFRPIRASATGTKQGVRSFSGKVYLHDGLGLVYKNVFVSRVMYAFEGLGGLSDYLPSSHCLVDINLMRFHDSTNIEKGTEGSFHFIFFFLLFIMKGERFSMKQKLKQQTSGSMSLSSYLQSSLTHDHFSWKGKKVEKGR